MSDDHNDKTVLSSGNPLLDNGDDTTGGSSYSQPTNIRSSINNDDDGGETESDKTVVVAVGLSSSNDATVIIGANDAAKTGSPTLTLGNTKVINNRFELLDVLGSGGMGVVFKALDRRKVEAKDRDPYVAIKLLNDDFKAHPHSVISLQREARRSQKLAHPNIVNVHDFDRDGDQVYMTMECLQGQPLDELLKANGKKPLAMDIAHRIVKDMCAAMIHAHNNNIAHSDFKPGNIFVTDAGEAKVLDFGIARAVTSGIGTGDSDNDGGSEHTLFDPGSLGALTPAYASREMLTGKLPEVGDDVYAVGCVTYELFTGHHPFNKKNAVEAKKLGLKPARIKSLTARQWRALRKALAFKRDDRYASAGDFWDDFDRHVSPMWWVAGFVLLIVGAAVLWSVEQNSRLEGLNEEAIRLQADQDNAYSNLQAWIKRQPVSEVELDLREAYNIYQRLAPADDDKLRAAKDEVVALYLDEAEAMRAKELFDEADERLAGAASWDATISASERYQTLAAHIAGDREAERLRLIAEQRAREEAMLLAQEQEAAAERARLAREASAQARAAAQQREDEYQHTLATVEGVLSCKTIPNFTALQQQLNTLKKLDNTRYQQKVPLFTEAMAICVKRIGTSNPAAGKAAQSSAMTVFPGSQVLGDLVIDACASTKLAPGSGRRDAKYCYDQLPGGVSGPRMVVVPGVDGGESYAIGRYEVSAKEFGVFCQAANDCKGVPDTSSDLPVRGLSVDQAKAYAAWLSKESGFEYRLPTYAEWINAARSTGRDKNLDPNCTVKRLNGTRSGEELRVAGGNFNDWGLYNVVGNVDEWAVDEGDALVVAGGRHTDRLADQDCSLASKKASNGEVSNATGFRLMRAIKR